MNAGRQIDWIGWQFEFSRRATTLAARHWNASDILTELEKRRIERSIATFQLGEQSDGRNLYRRVEALVVRRGPAALLTTTRYFIREEQHHAAQLKAFMAHHSIPLRKREWTDSIFRSLRRLAGFEWTVRVLVTAEVIGLIYYRALRRATGSPWLQRICRDFCADEAVHLRYEAELLATLAQAQSRPVQWLNRMAHCLLLEVASGVVYQQHRPVLLQAGYDWRRFRRGCRVVLRVTFFSKKSMLHRRGAAVLYHGTPSRPRTDHDQPDVYPFRPRLQAIANGLENHTDAGPGPCGREIH